MLFAFNTMVTTLFLKRLWCFSTSFCAWPSLLHFTISLDLTVVSLLLSSNTLAFISLGPCGFWRNPVPFVSGALVGVVLYSSGLWQNFPFMSCLWFQHEWASGVCGMVCMVSALIWMRNVPHRLWSLNTWSPVGGVDGREFRRRGLAEGRTSLRVSFESSQPNPTSSPLSALCSLLRVWFLSSPLLMLSLLLAARLPVWDGLYLCGVTGQPRLSSTSVLRHSVSSQWQKRHLHSTYHPLSQAYSC